MFLHYDGIFNRAARRGWHCIGRHGDIEYFLDSRLADCQETMKPNTGTRQQALRDRRKAAGLKQCEVWVPIAAEPKLRRYVAKLVRDAT